MKSARGITLAELLVSALLMGLVMTAVISFYVEAIAVSAKRDETSARLRRFHLGLDKIEQVLREGRVVQLRWRSILLLKLSEQSEADGFPLYDKAPAQIVSTEKGVLLVQDGIETMLLATQEGEHVVFEFLQEAPPAKSANTTISVSLYHTGFGKRSDLFFSRAINTQLY